MGVFYARVSPVGYVQPDGELGFGVTAEAFSSKAKAIAALAKLKFLRGVVIEGVHDEVAEGTPLEAPKTKAKPKKKGKR